MGCLLCCSRAACTSAKVQSAFRVQLLPAPEDVGASPRTSDDDAMFVGGKQEQNRVMTDVYQYGSVVALPLRMRTLLQQLGLYNTAYYYIVAYTYYELRVGEEYTHDKYTIDTPYSYTIQGLFLGEQHHDLIQAGKHVLIIGEPTKFYRRKAT